jgi:hypothetical protein
MGMPSYRAPRPGQRLTAGVLFRAIFPEALEQPCRIPSYHGTGRNANPVPRTRCAPYPDGEDDAQGGLAVEQAVQVAGAVLVLAGFVLAQLDVLDESAYAYLLPPHRLGRTHCHRRAVRRLGVRLPRRPVGARLGGRDRPPARPTYAEEWDGMIVALEFAGALGIVVPFALFQLGRTTQHSVLYLLLNLAGSTLLTVLAWLHRQWGFVVLQGVWTLVTAWSLARLPRRHAKPAEPR